MGHIGNRNDQAIATTRPWLAIDSIVEVPGRFVIDGYQPEIADILPIGLVFLSDLFRNLCRLLTDRGRPAVGNVIGTDGNVNFHPWCHVFAKHLDNLAQWLGAHGGLANYVHNNILAVAGIAAILLGNQYFVIDPRVFRNNEVDTTFLEKASHRLAGPVFQNFNDHTFAPASIINPINPSGHPIPMKHLTHLSGSEKQIGAPVIRHQKAEAIFVSNHPPRYQVGFLNGKVGATPVTNQLPVPTHGNQSPTKGFNALL